MEGLKTEALIVGGLELDMILKNSLQILPLASYG